MLVQSFATVTDDTNDASDNCVVWPSEMGAAAVACEAGANREAKRFK